MLLNSWCGSFTLVVKCIPLTCKLCCTC